ncbi:MAG: proton-conducting transporter membrane subunit [Chloroflexota bacterium]
MRCIRVPFGQGGDVIRNARCRKTNSPEGSLFQRYPPGSDLSALERSRKGVFWSYQAWRHPPGGGACPLSGRGHCDGEGRPFDELRQGARGLAISDYAGLGKKYPALAAAMTVFMLSLIGFPPTLGLVGKFYLFRAVIDGGYMGLAIIGVLTSLFSAYYYLRVVVTMYMQDGEPQTEREGWLDFTWSLSALVTVLFSLLPAPLFAWASQAVLKLF